MSRKAKHNATVRKRILDAAGPVFRSKGYHDARIDTIMAKAGLTRGAFYAHFPDKAGLFVAVLSEPPLLLTWLRARSAASPDALSLGMRHVFRTYLAPDHTPLVAAHCTLATLGRDAGLAGGPAAAAYATAFDATIAEMKRGGTTGQDSGTAETVLCLALGAIAFIANSDPIENDPQHIAHVAKMVDDKLCEHGP